MSGRRPSDLINEIQEATPGFAGEQDPLKRQKILNEIKAELAKLIKLSSEIDKVTPLIFEGEDVVSHLEPIEEFFDTLTDDLTEVKEYMLSFLEEVEDTGSESMAGLIPILSKIIILLQ